MLYTTKGGIAEVQGTVLILGDSISDQGQYVSWMNCWLALSGRTDVHFVNTGVSSETCSGLSEPAHPFARPCVLTRAQQALDLVKPDWVVVFYGVNDGIYYPFSEDRFAAYRAGITALLAKIHAAGARALLATPIGFDAPSFAGTLTPNGATEYSYIEPYAQYDDVMARYAAWVLADDGGAALADAVADLRGPFLADVAARRAADTSYNSGDGIHPDAHGHAVIARALLKTLFGVNTDALEALAGSTGDTQSAGERALFDLMYARDALSHFYWKEHIGHDNPNKANVPADWQTQTARLNAEIEALMQARANGFVQQGTWQGFATDTFFAESGYEVILAKPETAAAGRPWVWRTEFFGAFPAADLALLRRGWHVAQLKISDMYGCPKAVSLMEAFRVQLTQRYQLAQQAVLFGFSRGGLYAANYAAAYPENVRCLYLDAPVVSIESWPGGKGAGVGAPREFRECLAAYGANHDEPARVAGVISALIEAKLPLLLVAGEADTVVPYAENGARLAAAYQKTDIPFQLLLKPNVGHHPHSVENPEQAGLIFFLLEHGGAAK